MKKTELVSIIKEIISEAKLSTNNIYIATANLRGDLGIMKKGELFIKSKSSEGPDYVFLTLANPYQEYYEDVDVSDFKKYFRPINKDIDTSSMKLLNKWGLIDFGTEYWVISVSSSKSENSITKAVEHALTKKGNYGVSRQTADSPKLAMRKAEHNTGTLHEPLKDFFVAKMYADWVIVATTKDPYQLGAKKIANLIYSTNLLKYPI